MIRAFYTGIIEMEACFEPSIHPHGGRAGRKHYYSHNAFIDINGNTVVMHEGDATCYY